MGRSLTGTMIFPLLVAFLEGAAGIVYFVHDKPALGVAWICYAIACVGLAIAGEQ